MSEKLSAKVEQIEQVPDVQRELKKIAVSTPRPVVRTRDKLLIGTHIVLLIGLAITHHFLNRNFPALFAETGGRLVPKVIDTALILLIFLAIFRLLNVYLISRVS